MCSDKHEYTGRIENWPQKSLKYLFIIIIIIFFFFFAKYAVQKIRPRARGCRLTDLTPCKGGFPLLRVVTGFEKKTLLFFFLFFYFRDLN